MSRRLLHPVEPEVPGVATAEVVATEVPALRAADQLVGLDLALDELVLVLLVVVELEDPASLDRVVDGAHDLGIVPPGGDLEALLGGVMTQRSDDLLARGGQAGLRQMIAEQVDRRDQRLRLQRQQPGGAGEVVAIGVGVDLDLVSVDLCVEHVRAAAEVDDVQNVDVLV